MADPIASRSQGNMRYRSAVPAFNPATVSPRAIQGLVRAASELSAAVEGLAALPADAPAGVQSRVLQEHALRMRRELVRIGLLQPREGEGVS